MYLTSLSNQICERRRRLLNALAQSLKQTHHTLSFGLDTAATTSVLLMHKIFDFVLASISRMLHPSDCPWTLPLHHTPVFSVQIFLMVLVVSDLIERASLPVVTEFTICLLVLFLQEVRGNLLQSRFVIIVLGIGG